jgi:glyoxylase-like metal-dependent hydrolase (beta-lactamase superfamily II)
MNLFTIDTGFFKLDGGAMFGVVPKSIWHKINPADANNMCTWAMRCLLIEDGKRLILIDNGIGDKQDAKFFSHYYLHGDATLEHSLNNKGFTADDVTDVFLTHLHFDHCGGSIKFNKDRTGFIPAFKNATYWSHAEHWKWATEPNAREKASFLKENILPIKESGQLKFVNGASDLTTAIEIITHHNFHDSISIVIARGHTDAMMLPVIKQKDKALVFMADLLPSAGHIPIPYVMAYDTRPLLTLKEKAAFLTLAEKEKWTLFFEHDPVNECCTLSATEKGIRQAAAFKLSDLVS